MDCIWVNLKNVCQPFFPIYTSLYHNVIYTAGKLFSLVMILRMKGSCSVNLTFRALMNKIIGKQNLLPNIA